MRQGGPAGAGGLHCSLGARGLISIAHWQLCLCPGHAGISSQLFYITKICVLGKFQGTAAINLLRGLGAERGLWRTGLRPTAGKRALVSREEPAEGPFPRPEWSGNSPPGRALSPRRTLGKRQRNIQEERHSTPLTK